MAGDGLATYYRHLTSTEFLTLRVSGVEQVGMLVYLRALAPFVVSHGGICQVGSS